LDEKKNIAQQVGQINAEDINQDRNLQFITPHIVKELYEHDGNK
jgi:hypothetical protein